ncbi:hypothetical protein SUGI_0856890 [Cryptomeria japonica]|nr:hypothetical protein SUGI_0856890 [Cryptomeria japonica]
MPGTGYPHDERLLVSHPMYVAVHDFAQREVPSVLFDSTEVTHIKWVVKQKMEDLVKENGVNEPLLPNFSRPPEKDVSSRSRRLYHCRTAPSSYSNKNKTKIEDMHSILPYKTKGIRPTLSQAGLVLFIYLGVGMICFYNVEDELRGLRTSRLVDALYFTVVTMTSVGYGDLVPNGALPKLLACFFVFSGMALVGLLLSGAADYLVEKQEKLLIKAFHKQQNNGSNDLLNETKINKSKLKLLVFLDLAEVRTEDRQQSMVHWVLSRRTTRADLEAADMDSDGAVSPSEFVLYKLKEMGKIEEEDVALLIKEFNMLDADHSGTVTASDLNLTGQAPED